MKTQSIVVVLRNKTI